MAERAPNYVYEVAHVFITEILNQRWQGNLPNCRRALAGAKYFVSHKEHGPVAGTKEESAKRVIKTLRAMKAARVRMGSIHAITWGKPGDKEGRTWYDACNTVVRPPIYHALDVRWAEGETQ